MNKAQRIVVILYCLLLTYCCVWIPWHHPPDEDFILFGYGWLWSGPLNLGPRHAALTAPDLPLIFLRIVAATSISAATFFLAGLWKSATRS